MSTPVVRIQNLGKRFGGTQAVDGVSLDLHRGEILALLGENGAALSTGNRPRSTPRVCWAMWVATSTRAAASSP